jgi:hypothetical protein
LTTTTPSSNGTAIRIGGRDERSFAPARRDLS